MSIWRGSKLGDKSIPIEFATNAENAPRAIHRRAGRIDNRTSARRFAGPGRKITGAKRIAPGPILKTNSPMAPQKRLLIANQPTAPTQTSRMGLFIIFDLQVVWALSKDAYSVGDMLRRMILSQYLIH